MNKNWKQWIFKKAERLLWKRSTPLLYKEIAWQAVRFAAKCGRANPFSFALRPLASHKHLKRVMGVNLAVLMVVSAYFGPLPSLASDTGGVPSLVVLPEGEVKITTEEAVRFPLPVKDVSQTYWALHAGVDLRAPVGTPINPVMLGVVTETATDRFGYGQKIVVAHKNGYTTLYAHLSKIETKVGDQVTTETKIGEVGSTGRSTGPHLHLEIHDESGRPVNPLTVFGGR